MKILFVPLRNNFFRGLFLLLSFLHMPNQLSYKESLDSIKNRYFFVGFIFASRNFRTNPFRDHKFYSNHYEIVLKVTISPMQNCKITTTELSMSKKWIFPKSDNVFS